MKKRMLTLLLAACLAVSLLPVGALAEETEATAATETATETTEAVTEATEAPVDPDAESGTCGDGLTWVLEGKTLTVSGSGKMDDGAPWAAHAKKIKKVVLTGGVTGVGKECFYGYDRLEAVDFGNALVEIGERAFYGCTGLTVIHLPATFRSFGAECFRDCTSLQKVYCDGGMPRFNSSCLWTGDYVAVYHPTNNIWPQEAVSQLVSNFGGRLGIMMGNYGDSCEPDREVPEETEAPTQTAEPEVTELPTEMPTEAPTEATEAAEVILITTATEALPEETEPALTEPETAPAPTETEPPQAPEGEDLGGKSWIGIVMIAGVITFLLAGAMIFRSAGRKGGRYGR